MPNHQVIRTPAGDDLVVLTREAFQELVDARDHTHALASVEAGTLETLSAKEVAEALAAPSALAFWRERRALTQAALARKAGVPRSLLAQIEARTQDGSPALFVKLARVLRVRVEDLVEDAD